MNQATKPFSNRIAVVFDFDETLVPDTFDVLLEDCHLDVENFRQQRVQPLINQGWDKVLARAYCLIQESQRREGKDKITQGRLARIGRELQPFEGVPEMFEQLQERAQDWEHLTKIDANQRVVNLAPADYSEDSELMRSLFLAIENIGKQISLAQLGEGE